ncbi:MAG: type II toxin-antitoxin system VapC family toxin [Bacteroidia bacterium]|nr:type II toxin-antitoxin system VapC family toxin [Bacteroidia bacterium]
MKLVDSNILIYAAREEFSYLREMISDSSNYYSVISIVEVLGFPGLSSVDRQFFEAVFNVLTPVPIHAEIINMAVGVRSLKKISLGDSIIAATARVHGLEILTRNVSDFSWLAGIKVSNPIQ